MEDLTLCLIEFPGGASRIQLCTPEQIARLRREAQVTHLDGVTGWSSAAAPDANYIAERYLGVGGEISIPSSRRPARQPCTRGREIACLLKGKYEGELLLQRMRKFDQGPAFGRGFLLQAVSTSRRAATAARTEGGAGRGCGLSGVLRPLRASCRCCRDLLVSGWTPARGAMALTSIDAPATGFGGNI